MLFCIVKRDSYYEQHYLKCACFLPVIFPQWRHEATVEASLKRIQLKTDNQVSPHQLLRSICSSLFLCFDILLFMPARSSIHLKYLLEFFFSEQTIYSVGTQGWTFSIWDVVRWPVHFQITLCKYL